MQDFITREITVKAEMKKVFTAITDPQQIIKWFPDVVEGSLEVGQQPIFSFTSENHKARIFVESIKPYKYFAYRWVLGTKEVVEDVLKEKNTLVEFFLEELEHGTKVTVKESGFAALPAEVAAQSFTENSGGWEYMMKRLQKILSQA